MKYEKSAFAKVLSVMGTNTDSITDDDVLGFGLRRQNDDVSAEERRKAFRHYRKIFGLRGGERDNTPPVSVDIRGNAVDVETLIMKFQKHILKRANKYARYSSCPFEDLYQVGCLAVIEAYNGFDFEMGCTAEAFVAYVCRIISNRMMEEVDGMNVVRTERWYIYKRMMELRRQKRNMGMDLDELKNQMERGSVSIHAVDDNGDKLEDILSSMDILPDEGMMESEVKAIFANVLNSMPERDKLILKLIYEDKVTQRNIPEALAKKGYLGRSGQIVSQQAVSEFFKNALKKLKTKMREEM